MSEKKESRILKGLFGTQDVGSIIPGVLLAAVITVVAIYLNKWIGLLLGLKKSPLSSIMLAIILGMLFKNTVKLPQLFNSGISFSLKKLLRLGIILMGIRLSIFAVAKIGLMAVGIVVICIALGLLFTIYVSRKFGLPERLGTLVAVGTGICGASAIVATGPAIEAKEEEIAYAVGTITIFGIIVMFSYPYLSHLLLHLSHFQAGIFMGTSVHETAQVAGAGLMYDQLWVVKDTHPTGADVAIVTKLVRNTLMAVAIPLMAYLHMKRYKGGKGTKINPLKLFPLFIIGFILIAAVRSLGDYLIVKEHLVWDADSWSYLCHFLKRWSGYLLSVAMAGVGLGTDFRSLRKLGIKPFLVGLVAALFVGVVAVILVKILAPFLKV